MSIIVHCQDQGCDDECRTCSHNKPHEMGEWCLRSCPFAKTDPNNICRPFGIVTVEDEEPLE